ncbi:MAG: PilN domain-containing protein [bacterium]|nr:PilN domain-containing protein [bacterium]
MLNGETVAPVSAGSASAENGVKEVSSNQEEAKQEDKSPEIQSVKVTSVGSLGALVLIATVIALLGTGALFLYKTSRASKLVQEEKNYKTISDQLNSADLKKLAANLQEVQQGQESLTTALNQKVYWSKFWTVLSSVTPTAVYYNSLSMDSNGVVSLTGSASDLSSIAKFMVSLKKSPVFKDIKLGNTSVRESGGTVSTLFSATFTVNAEELKK